MNSPVYVAYYNEGEGDSHIAYFHDVEKAKDKVDMEIQHTIDIIGYDPLTGSKIEFWYNHYFVEEIKID